MIAARHKPLSPGERSVWAVAYVHARHAGFDPDLAIARAGVAVDGLETARQKGQLSERDRAMLEDMLGHPDELICPDDGKAVFVADVCTRCTRTVAYHRSQR